MNLLQLLNATNIDINSDILLSQLTIFEELETGNRIQLRDAPDLGPTKVVSVSEFLPQTR